ncbi:hypothetical protein C8R45DRAFT_952702 [Mycena sanguinolenta]|nr:hypothetical protein C8R45DRAFT_952702 [Mycena sanguinolenta]
MPRRQRPSSRAPPKQNRSTTTRVTVPRVSSKASLPGSGLKDAVSASSSEEQDGSGDEGESSQESEISGDEEPEIADDDDEDVDAPRISQWVDEDDHDSESYSSSEDAPEAIAGPSQLKSLEEDLSSLPLGALLRAKRALQKAQVDDSESEDSANESDRKPEKSSSKGKEKEKPEWSIAPRHDIAKRANKHAPTEVTSKRPVSRKRQVVEVKTTQSRDPRFLPLAGEFSAQKFQKHYGFLADSHKTELKTLRDNLKTARKLLASSPRDLRPEREAEVSRLEKAVKRAESLVNQDRKAKIDEEALTKLNDAEKAKRKDGKTGWWMKESEKKNFLLRARYDALAAEGGKRAVKKAIEKKQKKIGQKEKKSRPFAKSGGLKRRATDNNDGPPQKKRKS